MVLLRQNKTNPRIPEIKIKCRRSIVTWGSLYNKWRFIMKISSPSFCQIFSGILSFLNPFRNFTMLPSWLVWKKRHESKKDTVGVGYKLWRSVSLEWWWTLSSQVTCRRVARTYPPPLSSSAVPSQDRIISGPRWILPEDFILRTDGDFIDVTNIPNDIYFYEIEDTSTPL